MKTLFQIKKELESLAKDIDVLIGNQENISITSVWNSSFPKKINYPKHSFTKNPFIGKADEELKQKALHLLRYQNEVLNIPKISLVRKIGFKSMSTVNEILKRNSLSKGSAKRIIELFN